MAFQRGVHFSCADFLRGGTRIANPRQTASLHYMASRTKLALQTSSVFSLETLERKAHSKLKAARVERGAESQGLGWKAVITAGHVERAWHVADHIIDTRIIQPVEQIEALGCEFQTEALA